MTERRAGLEAPFLPSRESWAVNRLGLLGVWCRPGSFAGRTGHSGMVKIIADIPFKVDEGTVYRQVCFLPTITSRRQHGSSVRAADPLPPNAMRCRRRNVGSTWGTESTWSSASG